MLGDQGRWGKSVPYQASAGVPLVTAGPRIESGVTSDALVSLMDLAATFIDFAGLPLPAAMQSRSLRPLPDRGGGQHRDFERSAMKVARAHAGRCRMVQDHRYKLVEGFYEARALFDRETDPTESENIADSKPGEVARLAGLFDDA